MSYAVIRVNQNYDYVESVECLITFPEKESAYKYVQDLQKEIRDFWDRHSKYVKDFVHGLEIPINYPDWRSFMEQLIPKPNISFNTFIHFPDVFRRDLCHYFITYKPTFGGFNPPSSKFDGWLPSELFVVKLPI